MVIGIGVDLVETERVASMLERFGDRFVLRIMAPEEAARLPIEPGARRRALALAVAAKEAASKALGTGWSHGVRWRDVSVTLAPAPALELAANAAERARSLGWGGRSRLALSFAEHGSLAVAEVWLLS